MKTVGIIANADSGKDVRRLVSSASVFGDREKINILKRILMALDSLDVRQALIMPDPSGLTRRVLYELEGKLHRLQAGILELPFVAGDYRDSLGAAEAMAAEGCGCVITLGGDGTNRVVAKAIGDVPLLPVSAGTNNVFPFLVEGTTAGLAAAAFAHGAVRTRDCCRRMPLLQVCREGRPEETALIDAAVLDQHQVGARAVWEPGVIRELYLTRARPADIGLSAIGGCLQTLAPDAGLAMYIRTGENGRRVTAPIAPGLIRTITVDEHRLFGPGEAVAVTFKPCIIALDGEREMRVEDGDAVTVKLDPHGPLVIDVDRTLNAAVARGFLTSPPV